SRRSRTSARIDPVGRVGGSLRERYDAGAHVLAPDDERIPEDQQIAAGPEQPAEIEELRPAVRPVEVMHRHFDDAEPAVLYLLHHLDADDAARLLQVDPMKNRPPHQPEVAVDVSQPDAEQDADDVVIDAADDDAVQGIGAADLVAVDDVRAGRQVLPELPD